jgi:F-type H+-transporting ATPase subunit epsilon
VASLNLRIISPEGSIFESEVQSLAFPGEGGSFGILPHHAEMTSLTSSGLMSAKVEGGDPLEFLIHDGFAQVRKNVVTVLTRSAEKPQDIDLDRARQAADRAKERLQARVAELDLFRAQAALRRALMREMHARS